MAEPLTNAPAFEQFLEDKGGQAEQPPPLHFDYIPYSEFDSLPAPDFLIDGFLVGNAANLIFGASNSYKTMLAVDAACTIAPRLATLGLTVRALLPPPEYDWCDVLPEFEERRAIVEEEYIG